MRQSSAVFAVLITGPPGSGKSSVLMALADALSDDEIAHAAIDVEMLVWTHPPLSDAQWARQVSSTCRLHREAGHDLLLLAQTLETDADVAGLVSLTGGGDVVLVRLAAEPATLAERIIAREPPNWSGLPGLVEHAKRLARTMPDLAGVDLVLSTQGQRPEQVAQRIRDACPARLAARSH